MRRYLLPSLSVLALLTVLLGFAYPLAVTGIGQALFPRQANGSLVHRDGRMVGSSLLGQSFTARDGAPLRQYFQPRPSEAGTSGYDGSSSAASNLGPDNPLLIGFVPGVNAVGVDGAPSDRNPFATPADPDCVPMAPGAGGQPPTPVTSPGPGQRYERTRSGHYVCDPQTVPERAIAYRRFNDLAAGAPVPVDAVTASGSGLDPDISEANALLQAPRVAQARGLAPARVEALVRSHTQGRQLGFLGEPTVDVLQLNLALEATR